MSTTPERQPETETGYPAHPGPGRPAGPGEPNEHPPTGRHPVIIGHLVMGVALLGLVGVWALIIGDSVQGDDVRFLLPVPWVLAGLTGLAALVASDHRRSRRRAASQTAAR